MKKEKQVKTYKRRTKSGKMVTVKAHTAKYDAAEMARELAKKKGAGNELEERKKKPVQLELPFDWDEVDEKKILDEVKKTSKKESTKETQPKKSEKPTAKKETKSTKDAQPKAKSAKSESGQPFTAAEFKEWYQGTGSAADKKVAKALKAQLGRSGYKKLEDEAIDNYSSRGHLKMFKSLGNMGEDVKSKPKDSTTKNGTKVSSSKSDSANLKTEIQNQKDYVKKLLQNNKKGAKDEKMGSYISAEQKILSDLKKHKGSVLSEKDIVTNEKKAAKANKLTYLEDGMYSGKDGKSYRISVHPITGKASLHPLVGSTMGATNKQLREAGLKGKDYDTVDDEKLRSIIWGGPSAKKTTKATSKESKTSATAETLEKEANKYASFTRKTDASWIGATDYGKNNYRLYKKNGKYYAVDKNGKLASEGTTQKIVNNFSKAVGRKMESETTSSKSTKNGSELSKEKVGDGVAFKDNKAGQAWAKKNGEAFRGSNGRTYYKVGKDVYGNIIGGNGGTAWGKLNASKAKTLLQQAKKEQAAYNTKLEQAKAVIAEHEKNSSKNALSSFKASAAKKGYTYIGTHDGEYLFAKNGKAYSSGHVGGRIERTTYPAHVYKVAKKIGVEVDRKKVKQAWERRRFTK